MSKWRVADWSDRAGIVGLVMPNGLCLTEADRDEQGRIATFHAIADAMNREADGSRTATIGRETLRQLADVGSVELENGVLLVAARDFPPDFDEEVLL